MSIGPHCLFKTCTITDAPALPLSEVVGVLFLLNSVCLPLMPSGSSLCMLSYSLHALISPGATTSVEGVVGFSDTSVRRHVSEHQEVVLDVPQGTAVVFRKKVPNAAMCSACLI